MLGEGKRWGLRWQLLDDGGSYGWLVLCPGLVMGPKKSWVDVGIGLEIVLVAGLENQGLVLGLGQWAWDSGPGREQEPGLVLCWDL